VKFIAPQFEFPFVAKVKKSQRDIIPLPHYTITADGSVFPNPDGAIGWCAIVELNGERQSIEVGNAKRGTNQTAELRAVISGIEATPIGARVTVRSDSQYVINGCKTWCQSWARKKFVGVKNGELWKVLWGLIQERDVDFKWVRGHADDALNIECDFWAKKEREKVK